MSSLKPYYTYWVKEDRYLFYSEGSKGKFLKSIKFKRFYSTNLYELLLEDYIPSLDSYALNTTTDNRDVEKIFLTIIEIMIDYSNENLDKAILTRGTTNTVQRLERMFIHKLLPKISVNFDVFTLYLDDFTKSESFDPRITCDGYKFFNKTLSGKILVKKNK